MQITTRHKKFIAFLAMLFGCHFTHAQTISTKKMPSNSAIKAGATVSAMDDDDLVPDILSSKTYNYYCELNDSLVIYTNTDDDQHAAIRWKNRLYRLTRIETTTGANRFENKKAGLVWIGIPTKGMLLNSRLGQQLANECKTTDK